MVGFRVLALRIASANIRNAPRIVDLPELFGPTNTLKCSKEIENSRNALYLTNLTEVIRGPAIHSSRNRETTPGAPHLAFEMWDSATYFRPGPKSRRARLQPCPSGFGPRTKVGGGIPHLKSEMWGTRRSLSITRGMDGRSANHFRQICEVQSISRVLDLLRTLQCISRSEQLRQIQDTWCVPH